MKLVTLVVLLYTFVDILHTRPQFSYNTGLGDDSYLMTHGALENIPTSDNLVLVGSYSYLGFDGVNQIYVYTDAASGFRATTDFLVPRPVISIPFGDGDSKGISFGAGIGAGLSAGCAATLCGTGIG